MVNVTVGVGFFWNRKETELFSTSILSCSVRGTYEYATNVFRNVIEVTDDEFRTHGILFCVFLIPVDGRRQVLWNSRSQRIHRKIVEVIELASRLTTDRTGNPTTARRCSARACAARACANGQFRGQSFEGHTSRISVVAKQGADGLGSLSVMFRGKSLAVDFVTTDGCSQFFYVFFCCSRAASSSS